jgi:hypothetical protein
MKEILIKTIIASIIVLCCLHAFILFMGEEDESVRVVETRYFEGEKLMASVFPHTLMSAFKHLPLEIYPLRKDKNITRIEYHMSNGDVLSYDFANKELKKDEK